MGEWANGLMDYWFMPRGGLMYYWANVLQALQSYVAIVVNGVKELRHHKYHVCERAKGV